MFLRTILFIGLHLLCFTNVANPMVLLTANVEDIKRIARKFLSDNVADTIADLLIKATGSLRNNKDAISEENDQNQQDIDNVSSEGKIGRAGKRHPTATTANDYLDYDSKTTKRLSKQFTPGSMVYNTPAFEQDANPLDGELDDDFRTESTINDNEQSKQVRELYRQRINDNYDNDGEATTFGADQYDVETKQPDQPTRNSADEEDEAFAKFTSSQYSKNARHRLIATSGSIVLPRMPDASQE